MLTVTTRQAMKARSLPSLPTKNLPQAARMASSTTSGVSGWRRSVTGDKTNLYRYLEGTLSRLFNLSYSKPELFDPNHASAREPDLQLQQYMSSSAPFRQSGLQRRFDSSSDLEIIETFRQVLAKGLRSPNYSHFFSTELLKECARRELLGQLNSKELRKAVIVTFPPLHAWTRDHNIHRASQRHLAGAALERFSLFLDVHQRHSMPLHTDAAFSMLEHVAELGDEPCWRQVWTHDSIQQSIADLGDYELGRLVKIRLQAFMRHSEALAARELSGPELRQERNLIGQEAFSILRSAGQNRVLSVPAVSFACRTFKNVGHLETLDEVLDKYCGINLELPHEEPSKPIGARALRTPHLFNTILMAIKDSDSLSRLLATFETFAFKSSSRGFEQPKLKPCVNSTSLEVVLHAAKYQNTRWTAYHYFKVVIAAVHEQHQHVENELKQAIHNAKMLDVNEISTPVCITSEMVDSLWSAFALPRAAEAQRCFDLFHTLVKHIEQHQSSMNSLIEKYGAIESIRPTPQPANVKAYLVDVAYRGVLARQHLSDADARTASLRRLHYLTNCKRNIKGRLFTEEQERQALAMLPQLDNIRQLKHFDQDTKRIRQTRPKRSEVPDEEEAKSVLGSVSTPQDASPRSLFTQTEDQKSDSPAASNVNMA